jgi:hypothetical protein
MSIVNIEYNQQSLSAMHLPSPTQDPLRRRGF